MSTFVVIQSRHYGHVLLFTFLNPPQFRRLCVPVQRQRENLCQCRRLPSECLRRQQVSSDSASTFVFASHLPSGSSSSARNMVCPLQSRVAATGPQDGP